MITYLPSGSCEEKQHLSVSASSVAEYIVRRSGLGFSSCHLQLKRPDSRTEKDPSGPLFLGMHGGDGAAVRHPTWYNPTV